MVQPLVIKVGGLLIKTLTKPLANQIKSQAARPGWIRNVCLRYGRLHHNIESRAVLRLAGHHAKSIKPVTEDAAVSIGANVFSELFVFTTAGVILVLEIKKKERDDEAAKIKKEEVAAKEKADIENRFRAIEAELHSVSTSLHDTRLLLQQMKEEQEKKKGGWLHLQ